VEQFSGQKMKVQGNENYDDRSRIFLLRYNMYLLRCCNAINIVVLRSNVGDDKQTDAYNEYGVVTKGSVRRLQHQLQGSQIINLFNQSINQSRNFKMSYVSSHKDHTK